MPKVISTYVIGTTYPFTNLPKQERSIVNLQAYRDF